MLFTSLLERIIFQYDSWKENCNFENMETNQKFLQTHHFYKQSYWYSEGEFIEW